MWASVGSVARCQRFQSYCAPYYTVHIHFCTIYLYHYLWYTYWLAQTFLKIVFTFASLRILVNLCLLWMFQKYIASLFFSFKFVAQKYIWFLLDGKCIQFLVGKNDTTCMVLRSCARFQEVGTPGSGWDTRIVWYDMKRYDQAEKKTSLKIFASHSF